MLWSPQPPTQASSALSLNSCLTPSSLSHAPSDRSLSPRSLRGSPHPPVGLPYPAIPHQEVAVQDTGTLACPDLSVCFPKSRSSLTCLPSFYRLLCSAHTQSILVD